MEGLTMDRRTRFFSGMLSGLLLATGMAMADGDSAEDASYCMDVNIGGFHMMPDEGVCTVRDYMSGELQDAFYPFTQEDHLFNCEYFGAFTPLPNGAMVPSSVVSQGEIMGTIGGHPFSASLYCASLTNWYQDSCADPSDPMSCRFQLAQPFLTPSEDDGSFYPRVTEVSVFDGVITVEKRNKTVEVPLVMATRAAGMMHVEDLFAPLVGATITHSALGMVTYKDDGDRAKVLNGSLDLLLQGHIFHPASVDEDPKAAVIKGTICSEDLYKLLNKKGGKGKKGPKGKDHDDD
jgi:hypothetical protein